MFGAVFIALAAVIAALIIAMCAIIAAGVVISLIAIIYGVTQLFTFRAAGIYEIGLGILVGGVTAFAAIILYNIAIRFLPWVMKKVGRLFSFVFDKLRELYVNYRRECYDI